MDHPTWIGRTLSGRYRIEALLGQGGMSAVYKAIDPNLKRVVAIKLIHPHLSTDPMFVLRFESEASAVASLRHQNIVQVYDFNNDGGVYYMVLEFIPGETLQDRLKRLLESGRLLSVEDALKFTINIAEAVGYAHQRGMVHRDIKPANIMLDVQGQAILMDFGIVKILGGDSHTSTGAVVGTARYMSPEIIRGEVADHRADIYSLGVTLYEMLSGRPPFVSDSAMTLMMMHLNDPIPDVRDFRENIDPALVDILEKSLAKDRANRYQSAAEMAVDLRQALAYIGGQQTAVHVPAIRQSQTVPPKPESKPVPATEIAPRLGTADVPQPLPPPSVASKKVAPAFNFRILGFVFGIFVVLGCIGLAARSILNNFPSVISSPTLFVPTQAAAINTLSPTQTPVPPTQTLVPTTPAFSVGSTMPGNDGMTLVYVPAGEFTMGSENGGQDQKPVHTVYLDAFWIDKTEVTNQMYAVCVEAGACEEPTDKSSHNRPSYYGNAEYDKYPVIHVNWEMAKTYCEWAGRRLPTEAEWEKAARGVEAYIYPWGDGETNKDLLNYNDPTGGDTKEVGAYPMGASPYGALDMAGNVWEWVADWYSDTYYAASADDNPLGPESGDRRSLRGGSWYWDEYYVQTTFRNRVDPASEDLNIGFRCAVSATP